MASSGSTATRSADASRRRRRQPGRPIGSTGAETRRGILEAALRAFATHGYEGASVRDLARELGISHNLVNHHYGSKEKLWTAALEHAFAPSARELVSLIELSSRDADWDETVRTCVTSAFALLARNPEVTAILVHESARGGPRLDFLFDHYMRPFVDLLTVLLGGADGRRTNDVNVRAAMLFLFSGMTALFTHRGLASKLGGPVPTSHEELARYTDSVAEFIAHGLARPGRAAPRGWRGPARRSRRPRRRGA